MCGVRQVTRAGGGSRCIEHTHHVFIQYMAGKTSGVFIQYMAGKTSGVFMQYMTGKSSGVLIVCLLINIFII